MVGKKKINQRSMSWRNKSMKVIESLSESETDAVRATSRFDVSGLSEMSFLIMYVFSVP